MGHDIMAFYNAEHFEANTNSVAELSHAAFNPDNHLIYEALNCMDLYRGVSGSGDERYFSLQQLKDALHYLEAQSKNNSVDRDIKFIKECISNTFNEKIFITFF